MATFRQVLVATDFSEASSPALRVARDLAAESGAMLTVLHVCEVPGYTEGDGPAPFEAAAEHAGGAQARLDRLMPAIRDGCPNARDLVKVGAPWREILAVAAEIHADLIVIGTHGRTGMAHALLGSVAERVVRRSVVPVLTVRNGGGGP